MGDLYAGLCAAGSALTIRSPRIEAVAWSHELVAASHASATSWPRTESGVKAHIQVWTDAQLQS